MNKSKEELAAEITVAALAAGKLEASATATFLSGVINVLHADPTASANGVADELNGSTPAQVDPLDSIKKTHIVCLECGKEFKTLSPTHLNTHALTQADYRAKYGFKARQPLCALQISASRRRAAKKRGLPAGLRRSMAAKKKASKASA